MTGFTHLFQPLRIRGCTLKNRIMSSGHDTTLPVEELSDALEGLNVEAHVIGDAASPCTAEEAVYEGLKVAAEI